jgi:hypothetical protein
MQMNPKAIKVSMTQQEREYLVGLLNKVQKQVYADLCSKKSDKSRETLTEFLNFQTTLINKINK